MNYADEYIEAKVEAAHWRVKHEHASQNLRFYRESYYKYFDEHVKLLGEHAMILATSVRLESTIIALRAEISGLEEKIALLHKQSKPDRRMPSTKLRERVVKRDGHVCRYCKCDIEPGSEHIDHVYPYSKGGETSFGNLVVACKSCNIEKNNTVGIWPKEI